MKKIKTIDLWTEQHCNQYECFNGAFVDGFLKGVAFNYYKIIQNCNCLITTSEGIMITNKHQAIVFYLNDKPVRLMVINKNTNVSKCIDIALNQFFQGQKLKDLFEQLSISSSVIDLKEKAIYNQANPDLELDVGSCDRFSLMYQMLQGSYTESDTNYGNYQTDQYEFLPHLFVHYKLITDEEVFDIHHRCGFMNILKTRLIPLQDDSPLTKTN